MLSISGKTLIGLGIFVLLLALGGTLWRCHIGSFRALDSAFLEMVCPAGRMAKWPGVTVYHGLFSGLAKTWMVGFATLAVGMVFCWLQTPSRQIARSQDFEHRDVSTESASLPPAHYPDPTAAPLWAEDFSFILLNGLLWEPRWGLCLFTSNGRLDDFFPQIMFQYASEWAVDTPGAQFDDASLAAWRVRMMGPSPMRRAKRPENVRSLNISGQAVRLHSVLRFEIPQRLNDPTWLFSSLETAMPALSGRAPALLIAAIQELARHESTWIDMLRAMPGQATMPIHRLEIVMPAALAMRFPNDILADLVQMADGPYLVAQAPL